MSAIVVERALYTTVREHLRGRIEQVGFFLADFEDDLGSLTLHEWRPMPPEAFEYQGAFHVALRDEIRPEVIKWAWDARRCLVEVHSHGDEGVAQFSASDVWGLEEWVPHVRWRLRGLPYAAIVTAGDTFDALAWIGDAAEPSQVERIEVDGDACRATGRTLARRSWEETSHGG
jgi:hypothetical protein